MTSARANNKRWSIDRCPKSAASIKAVHLVLFLSESNEPSPFPRSIASGKNFWKWQVHTDLATTLAISKHHLHFWQLIFYGNLLQCGIFKPPPFTPADLQIASSNWWFTSALPCSKISKVSNWPGRLPSQFIRAHYSRNLWESMAMRRPAWNFPGGGSFIHFPWRFANEVRLKTRKPLSDRDTTMPHQGYTMLVVSIFIY